MANAAAITVNDLTLDSDLLQPAGNALDTGSTEVLLDADVGGASDRFILLVSNTDDDQALTVRCLAGNSPPAIRAGLGDKSITVAFGTTRVFGPFEAARFIRTGGKLRFGFLPASGTIAATIRGYRLPKV